MSDVQLLDQVTNLAVGSMEKLEAHRRGLYHAALSVLLVDATGQQIVQRRAAGKYHSGGLWANACCSHPAPGEPVSSAASRRLYEELGISVPLVVLGTIIYRAEVGALTEFEHVTLLGGVLGGELGGAMAPNPAEVSEVRTLPAEALWQLPLTPWFKLYLRIVGQDPTQLIKAAFAGAKPKDFGRFLDLQ